MIKFLSFIAEMLRIIILLFLGLTLLGAMEAWIYSIFDEQILQQSSSYWLLLFIANISITFIFYRNRWQFSGWCKSEKNMKLSKGTTWIIAEISFVLFLLPAVLHALQI